MQFRIHRITFFIVILIVSYTLPVFAQHGHVISNHPMLFPSHDMLLQQRMMLYGKKSNKLYTVEELAGEYDFTVLMKDSTTLHVESRIMYDSTLKKYYLLQINRKYPKSDSAHRWQHIYPNQTRYIVRKDSDDNRPDYVYYVGGMATDSCWLFKAHDGRVKGYSYLSERPGYDFTVIALQQDDGPIIKFSPDNLRSMINSDKKAMELFDIKAYMDAIDKFNKDNPAN